MALLSDLTREQNRTKAMAFIGVSFGVTFAIAMVLGPIITHKLGLHALFWMIAGLATLGFCSRCGWYRTVKITCSTASPAWSKVASARC